MVADLSKNYLGWGTNTESVRVVLGIPGSGSGGLSVDVSVALRMPLDSRMTRFAGVAIFGEEEGWLIPAALIGADNMSIGDRVIDADGVEYQIKAAKLIRAGSSRIHWECLVMRER